MARQPSSAAAEKAELVSVVKGGTVRDHSMGWGRSVSRQQGQEGGCEDAISERTMISRKVESKDARMEWKRESFDNYQDICRCAIVLVSKTAKKIQFLLAGR